MFEATEAFSRTSYAASSTTKTAGSGTGGSPTKCSLTAAAATIPAPHQQPHQSCPTSASSARQSDPNDRHRLMPDADTMAEQHDTDHIPWRCWMKKAQQMMQDIPWHQLRNVRWMNKRASARTAYVPTDIEHLANVTTHGIWVVPAIIAAMQLIWRSQSPSQYVVALVYGISLALLYIVSTVFHCVFYCNRNRPLKDILHRCDRAMIYIFIAGSYFPWLSLSTPIDSNALLFCLKWTTWLLAAFGIIYQQLYHERYKCLETMLYILMGVGPSVVIVCCGHEFNGMVELKKGGLVYLTGIIFFKADGSIPFAHAIWHLFVVLASTFHYFAILNYLFPVEAAAAAIVV